jgi:shikimate kinase
VLFYFRLNKLTRISLIGMPGGGKSTVGRHLAKRLGLSFFDSDAVFEQRFRTTIKDFFGSEGEPAFRDAETAIISDLLEQNGLVLATGGGAILREENRTLLRERSVVVYLRSSPEEIYKRLKNDTQRPLLQVADPMARLKELHSQRDPLYQSTAHFVVETGRPSVQMLVNMIAMQLELSNVSPGQGHF